MPNSPSGSGSGSGLAADSARRLPAEPWIADPPGSRYGADCTTGTRVSYVCTMRIVRFSVFLLLAAAAIPTSAWAQDRDRETTGLRVTVIGEGLRFRDGHDPWYAAGLRVGADPAFGTVSAEWRRSSRFGRWDDLVGLDAWFHASRHWYANARLELGPGADVHPGTDLLAEVFRPISGGWEPSIQLRLMRWPGTDVLLGGGAIGRYSGAWYLRAQAVVSRSRDGTGAAFVAAARRYLREPDRYVEGQAVAGREVIPTGPAGLLETSTTRAVALRVRWGVAGPWHVGVSVVSQDDRALGRREGLSAELSARL